MLGTKTASPHPAPALLQALEQKLQQAGSIASTPTASSAAGSGGPPAMAAPGYKWVLMKEGPGGMHPSQTYANLAAGEVAASGPASAALDGGAAAQQAQQQPAQEEIQPAEDDNTIGGLTLWGSSAATAVPALSGALRGGSEPQLAALQQAVRELEAIRDRWAGGG